MGVGKPRSGAIYPAVFLTSAGVLMLQVALTRLFSFTLWYHFAYVVISLALLGYGASGALLSAFPGLLRANLPRTLFLCALGSAVLIPASLLVYSHTPFYPLQLFVEEAQWWYLLAYYAAAGAPFFLAGVCIAGAISAAAERVTRVYCADLVGAGLGAGLVVPLIWRLETPGVVMLASGLMAGAAVCWAIWWRPAAMLAPLALAAAIAAGGAGFWRHLEFRPSSEKLMSVLLKAGAHEVRSRDQGPVADVSAPPIPGCRLRPEYTRWGAVFRVDVLEPVDDPRPAVGWCQGVSIRYHGMLPRVLHVPHDGDAHTAIYNASNERDLNRFLWNCNVSLPYVLLRPHPEVLVIGGGGGREVLTAVSHGARRATAVELDPITADLVTRRLADYAGRLHERPGVRYLVGEGRSFVRRCQRKYDLIQIHGTDTLTAANIGANVLFENYIYTVEAITDYLACLRDDGILCVSNIEPTTPLGGFEFPQGILRAGAALAALQRLGVKHPDQSIIAIAPRGEMSYLVRRRPFTREEVDRLKQYCAENGYQPIHLPHYSLRNELARFLRASPERRAEWVRNSALRRDPPTDDSPFIWPYFKWRYVFHPGHRYELAAMRSGQLVMVPLLGVAVLSALAFILGPLAIFRRRGIYSPAGAGLGIYFAALGFGFMFIEISFIQKFVLFLGYPTYSLTVVLSALLVSSGVGSLSSQRLISRAERSLVWTLGGLLVLGALYLAFGSSVFEAFLGYPLWVRVIIAVGLIAPLGFAMGMFFPTGIRVVNEVAPAFVPWAWGINASTSVVAAILAVMLAMTVGFRMVAILAFGIYVVGVAGLYWGHRRARTAAPLPRGSAATPAPATVNQ